MNGEELNAQDDVFVWREWECLGVNAGITGRVFTGKNMTCDIRRLAAILNVNDHRCIYLDQHHSADIVTDDGAMSGVFRGDGIVTGHGDLLMVIRTADCFPVFLCSPERSVAALLHVGWKPAWRGILENTLVLLRERYHCDPAELKVLLGPGLQRCCFEVQPDFPGRQLFDRHIATDGGRLWLDLSGYIAATLTDHGLRRENIGDVKICSACRCDLVYSWRREHTDNRTLSFFAFNPR